MSEVRTVSWESIADWFAKHEQTIRDVMKFEGLRGAVNEVLRLAPDQPELAALREELAAANEKIDQAWNRSHAIDHKGFIPGALDAWKRPVPQHLPYDFSGNPGASATQYCNGWNDCGGYWSGHAADLQQRLADAERRNAAMVEICRAIQDDPRLWLMTSSALAGKISAALNPNPEAASHDE